MTNDTLWPTFLILFLGVVVISALWRLRRRVKVNIWERGALYIDGAFERILPPGRHTLWGSPRRSLVVPIYMGPQYQSVGPVEVVTLDRLPARLTAMCVYRLTDAELSIQQPVTQALTLSVQTALVRLAAQRSMEDLIARVDGLNEALLAGVETEQGAATIDTVTLTIVALPPELRRLMSEVERARLEGLAALERARGEHAALRSLANASRLLKDNPELAHLRLLQTVASARNATIVVGDRPATPGGAGGVDLP